MTDFARINAMCNDHESVLACTMVSLIDGKAQGIPVPNHFLSDFGPEKFCLPRISSGSKITIMILHTKKTGSLKETAAFFFRRTPTMPSREMPICDPRVFRGEKHFVQSI